MTTGSMPSVTAIIDRIYPFPDVAKNRWVNSMSEKLWRDISYEDLMDIAQRGGNYLHDYARQLCWGMPMFDAPPDHYAPFCDGIFDFVKERNVKMLLAERRVEKCWEFYWHIDQLSEMDYNWERVKVLLDFKSYGLTNILLGIKEDMEKKSIIWNKKKVQLQLSMYRDALQDTFEQYRNDRIFLMCVWIAKGRCETIMLPYDISAYEQYKN